MTTSSSSSSSSSMMSSRESQERLPRLKSSRLLSSSSTPMKGFLGVAEVRRGWEGSSVKDSPGDESVCAKIVQPRHAKCILLVQNPDLSIMSNLGVHICVYSLNLGRLRGETETERERKKNIEIDKWLEIERKKVSE